MLYLRNCALVAALLACVSGRCYAQSPEPATQAQRAESKTKTFIDYFLPTPRHGAFAADAWVRRMSCRATQNGLEDVTIKRYCYWDGSIIKAGRRQVSHGCQPLG